MIYEMIAPRVLSLLMSDLIHFCIIHCQKWIMVKLSSLHDNFACWLICQFIILFKGLYLGLYINCLFRLRETRLLVFAKGCLFDLWNAPNVKATSLVFAVLCEGFRRESSSQICLWIIFVCRVVLKLTHLFPDSWLVRIVKLKRCRLHPLRLPSLIFFTLNF